MRLLATLLLGLTLLVANTSSAAQSAISRPAGSNGKATEVRVQVVLVDVDEINMTKPSDFEGKYVAVSAGAVLGGGAGAMSMKND
jgi:hypothetical protein